MLVEDGLDDGVDNKFAEELELDRPPGDEVSDFTIDVAFMDDVCWADTDTAAVN